MGASTTLSMTFKNFVNLIRMSRLCWLVFELLPTFAIERGVFVVSVRARAICHHHRRSPHHCLIYSSLSSALSLPSYIGHPDLIGCPGSSLVVQQLSMINLHYWELLHFKTDTSKTPRTVNELYLHLHTVNHDGVTFIDTRLELFYAKLQTRRQELTQAIPNQSMDDEVVYYKVAGECPKGRVHGLWSLGRKKRRYADPSASTSQVPPMVPRSEFDNVAKELR
ncbi:hypothetical protein Syun_009826 [Stephania yunnanensis]|uniref:Uncharacterized protein n=1 Tax=Stephania yunnanensis TaxID=152371 RepID=A0AAP0KHQ7_9MAGN